MFYCLWVFHLQLKHKDGSVSATKITLTPVASLILSLPWMALILCLCKRQLWDGEDHGCQRRAAPFTLQLCFMQALLTWTIKLTSLKLRFFICNGGIKILEIDLLGGTNSWQTINVKQILIPVPFTVNLSAPDWIWSSCFDLLSPSLYNSIPFT